MKKYAPIVRLLFHSVRPSKRFKHTGSDLCNNIIYYNDVTWSFRCLLVEQPVHINKKKIYAPRINDYLWGESANHRQVASDLRRRGAPVTSL